jgi:hypothetical protein
MTIQSFMLHTLHPCDVPVFHAHFEVSAMARTINLTASPTWPGVADDYILRFEEHSIGRMRLAEDGWEWHLNVPMEMPVWAKGTTNNFEECRNAFAAAWGRFLKETSPERLERAWELERAFEARQHRMETVKKDGDLTP